MKLELTIPTSLSEIPLKHYQAFQSVAKNSNDEEFISEKMIELFCGIELNQVIKIKASDISEMVAHFNKLFSEKQPFVHRFKIQDVEFGFITDLENISWGEYIDLEKNISSWDTMHKAMAVMYRPITKRKGDKYEIEEYQSAVNYADVMKFAPVSIVFAASVFFYHLGNELLIALTDYLEKELKTQDLTTILNKLNLENSGGGISQFTHSLRETLQNLMQLQENHWLSV